MTRMKIRRVGNSHGVIIPQAVMRALDLQQGDELSVARLRSGELRLRRVRARPAPDTPGGMIHRHLRSAGFDTPAQVHSALEHGSYHDIQELLRRLRADPWGREATAAEHAAATSAVYGWPRVLSLTLRLAREEATH